MGDGHGWPILAGDPIEPGNHCLRISIQEETQPVRNHNRIVDCLCGSIRQSEEHEISSGFRGEVRFHRSQLSRLVIGDRSSDEVSAQRLKEGRNAAEHQRDGKRVPMELTQRLAQEKKCMDARHEKSGRGEGRELHVQCFMKGERVQKWD